MSKIIVFVKIMFPMALQDHHELCDAECIANTGIKPFS